MTGKTLFIATPTYDEWVCIEYTASLLETGILLSQGGVGIVHCIAPGNPFLDMSRNGIIDRFLESDATDLLFVDADVGWDAKAVGRVLASPQEVVGGLVPKRDASREDLYHQNALTGVLDKDGLLQSLELPTAFMRIKRSAFDKLKKPYFKIGSNAKDFGEDIYFCRRWLETGNFCWIDTDITFTHRGGKSWKGNFFDYCIKTGMMKVTEAA